MKKWWFFRGFWLLASRGSGYMSKARAWALLPAFLKFSKILFFSNRIIFCEMGMICLKKHPNLTPWLTIGNPIETNVFAGLTECGISRHKTCSSCRKKSIFKFYIFWNFQKCWEECPCSVLWLRTTPTRCQQRNTSQNLKISIQKHTFPCQNMVFLVRTSPQ